MSEMLDNVLAKVRRAHLSLLPVVFQGFFFLYKVGELLQEVEVGQSSGSRTKTLFFFLPFLGSLFFVFFFLVVAFALACYMAPRLREFFSKGAQCPKEMREITTGGLFVY